MEVESKFWRDKFWYVKKDCSEKSRYFWDCSENFWSKVLTILKACCSQTSRREVVLKFLKKDFKKVSEFFEWMFQKQSYLIFEERKFFKFENFF